MEVESQYTGIGTSFSSIRYLCIGIVTVTALLNLVSKVLLIDTISLTKVKSLSGDGKGNEILVMLISSSLNKLPSGIDTSVP